MDSPNFSNQQQEQEQISRKLNSRVSPGAAAFWRDACRLMEMEPLLESTTHLVGHLLREIESSLRDVLMPISEPSEQGANKKKPSGDEKHKAEIEAVLKVLEIPEISPVGQTWLSLPGRNNKYGLHKRAHRKALDRPRPIDSEFREFWNKMQAVLDGVLDRFEAKYAKVFCLLDELAAKHEPTKQDLEELCNSIPNSFATRRYFFDRLHSPGWLNKLQQEGFFQNPPEPEEASEGGEIRLLWPQSRYLVRMASQEPAIVLEIAQEILKTGTKNIFVHEDLADAARLMPPEMAEMVASWVEKEIEWLKEQEDLDFSLAEKLGELVIYLAKNNQVEAALALLRELLAVLPNPQSSRWGQEPIARIKDYEYSEILYEVALPSPCTTMSRNLILENYRPRLLEVAGEPTFEMLCNLLDNAVRLSPAQDYSHSHRVRIEDDPLGIRELLISAVRDAAEHLARHNPVAVSDLVSVLESYNWTIFHRLALHLLRRFPNEVQGLIAARLTERDRFQNQQWFYEYKLLLSEQFSLLPSEAQETILAWIKEGLTNVSWVSESEADRASYLKMWKRNWLHWLSILGSALPEPWQQQYEHLVEELGAAEPLQPTGGIRPLLFESNNLKSPAELEATRDFDEMPTVREVLEGDLDPEQELSPLIWYTCGKQLPELINRDWNWTVEKLEKIFPKDEAFQKLRHAAWEGYVTSDPPYLDLFAILREEYSQAIDHFGRPAHEELCFLNPDEALTQHLMQLYWHGQLELGESDQLLERFFKKAPEQNRVAFMRGLGWLLSRDQSEVSPELLERLQRLWEWRIGKILGLPAITIYASELKTFGSWFACGRFDSQWAIAQLMEVFKLAQDVDELWMVRRHLATIPPSMPLEAVNCLDLIAEADNRKGFSGFLLNAQKDSRAIVSAALQSADEETRKAAKELISRLLARNYADLRDLRSDGEV